MVWTLVTSTLITLAWCYKGSWSRHIKFVQNQLLAFLLHSCINRKHKSIKFHPKCLNADLNHVNFNFNSNLYHFNIHLSLMSQKKKPLTQKFISQKCMNLEWTHSLLIHFSNCCHFRIFSWVNHKVYWLGRIGYTQICHIYQLLIKLECKHARHSTQQNIYFFPPSNENLKAFETNSNKSHQYQNWEWIEIETKFDDDDDER